MEKWINDVVERLNRELVAWERILSNAKLTLEEAQKAVREAKSRVGIIQDSVRLLTALGEPVEPEAPL